MGKSKNSYSSKLEEKKLNDIKREYIAKGYEVIVRPKRNEMPSFLSNYVPDMIAKKDDDYVVVEIKSKSTLNKFTDIRKITEDINRQKNWRFELIVTNPKEEIHDYDDSINLSIKEIKDKLDSINKLISEKIYDATYLISWSLLEGIMRVILSKNLDKDTSQFMPLKLVKTMYFYGFITNNELKKLNSFSSTRNKISHGFSVRSNYHAEIEAITQIIDRLYKSYLSSEKKK